jgi:hypothetical protein
MFPHGRNREIPRWRDTQGAHACSDVMRPQVVAMRALSVVSMEGGLARSFAEGVVLRRRIAGRTAEANLAHPRTIDPREGVDPFGRVKQT